MNKKYYESIDFLKVLLLALIIISSYTLVNSTGVPILAILNFCVGAFYLIYGYFVLRDGEDLPQRLKRAIRNTAIAFVIAAVVYFALVCLISLLNNGNIAALFNKKAIFEFFVLNGWEPTIGGNIWIISALLYALIIFYFMNKWKLLRFDIPIMIVLFLIAIVFGEGAGLIGFNVRGYSYIPGCFLTRAMPYMLLGRIIYKARFKRDFRKIKNWMWAAIFFVGVALTVIETNALTSADKLVYINHLIGFIPMSVAAVMFFLNLKRKFVFGKYYADIGYAGFYLYSVVAQVLYLVIVNNFEEVPTWVYSLLGLFTLVITLILAILYARIKNGKLKKADKTDNKGNEEETDETSV